MGIAIHNHPATLLLARPSKHSALAVFLLFVCASTSRSYLSVFAAEMLSFIIANIRACVEYSD